VISHGYGQGFTAEFDWIGTRDPSAWLAIPAATQFHLLHGGASLRERNVRLAREAAMLLADLDSSEAIDALIAGEIDVAMVASQLDASFLQRALDAPEFD
jgi:isopenicillin-N epimerase